MADDEGLNRAEIAAKGGVARKEALTQERADRNSAERCVG